MKKSLFAAALFAGSAIATMAHAADGTINFTGTITDVACTISPASATQNVLMGNVAASALSTPGAVAAPSRFSIELSACPPTISGATVKFDGPSDASNSSLLALTSGGGAATGVGIGLYEQDAATQIPVGGASANKALISGVTNTFTFFAKYVANGAAVVAGPANAVTDFTIIYN